jgi:hypothetical protein
MLQRLELRLYLPKLVTDGRLTICRERIPMHRLSARMGQDQYRHIPIRRLSSSRIPQELHDRLSAYFCFYANGYSGGSFVKVAGYPRRTGLL